MREGEQLPLAAGEGQDFADCMDALTVSGCVAPGEGAREGAREIAREGDRERVYGKSRGRKERGWVDVYNAPSGLFPSIS